MFCDFICVNLNDNLWLSLERKILQNNLYYFYLLLNKVFYLLILIIYIYIVDYNCNYILIEYNL